MPKKIIGVDLGVSEVKFAVFSGSTIEKTAHVQTPENMIRDGMPVSPEAMAAFLKEAAARNGLRGGAWALSLSPAQSFTRCVTVPRMNVEQLNLNLPYEFRDYITQGKEKYQYDYAVLETRKGQDGAGDEMDLMACAALKSTLTQLQATFRQAGMRLKRIVTEEFAYRNLLRRAYPKGNEPICLIDFGHTSTRIHIFKGERFEVTRIIDTGGAYQDNVIAELLGEDAFLSHTRKEANQSGILEADACLELYRSIALEIMRAINFYNYDSQAALEQIYVMGGGVLNPYLLKELEEVLGMEIKNASELLPKGRHVERETRCLFAAAVGAAWQREG